MPLFILIFFGLIEYGWMFVKVQQINSAARHGARVGIVESATNAEVNSAVASLMTNAGMGSSGYSVTLNPIDTSAVVAGNEFTVTVSVTYANITLMNLPLVPVPVTLLRSTTMAKEGTP